MRMQYVRVNQAVYARDIILPTYTQSGGYLCTVTALLQQSKARSAVTSSICISMYVGIYNRILTALSCPFTFLGVYVYLYIYI